MPIVIKNLTADIPEKLPHELFETVLQTNGFRLERIVSQGHSTPPGEWYDQDNYELVLVIQGTGRLVFADSPTPITMQAGDYLIIPAHCRHRVEATSSEPATVWLALHYCR